MNTKNNSLFSLLGISATVAAIVVTLPQPVTANEAAVREAFETYRTAILSQDADGAYKAVDGNTKDYYDEMLQQTLDADAATVRSLPILDQLIILRSRQQIPAVELTAMDGESFFKYAVDRSWIDPSSVQQFNIDNIAVSGNTATTSLAKNGQVAPFGFTFNQEADGWKIDLTSILPFSERAMQQLVGESGMNQDEFLLFLVKSVSGADVPDSIWQPVSE